LGCCLHALSYRIWTNAGSAASRISIAPARVLKEQTLRIANGASRISTSGRCGCRNNIVLATLSLTIRLEAGQADTALSIAHRRRVGRNGGKSRHWGKNREARVASRLYPAMPCIRFHEGSSGTLSVLERKRGPYQHR
jgi:hypothetical protein